MKKRRYADLYGYSPEEFDEWLEKASLSSLKCSAKKPLHEFDKDSVFSAYNEGLRKAIGCGCARSPGGDSAPGRVKPALLLAYPAYFEQRLSPWIVWFTSSLSNLPKRTLLLKPPGPTFFISASSTLFPFQPERHVLQTQRTLFRSRRAFSNEKCIQPHYSAPPLVRPPPPLRLWQANKLSLYIYLSLIQSFHLPSISQTFFNCFPPCQLTCRKIFTTI